MLYGKCCDSILVSKLFEVYSCAVVACTLLLFAVTLIKFSEDYKKGLSMMIFSRVKSINVIGFRYGVFGNEARVIDTF